jgi:hypothetical protein
MKWQRKKYHDLLRFNTKEQPLYDVTHGQYKQTLRHSRNTVCRAGNTATRSLCKGSRLLVRSEEIQV